MGTGGWLVSTAYVLECVVAWLAEQDEPRTAREIAAALREEDYGWSLKELDESMGLFDMSCPVNLLDMTEEPLESEPHAAKWREKIRAQARGEVVAPMLIDEDSEWGEVDEDPGRGYVEPEGVPET